MTALPRPLDGCHACFTVARMVTVAPHTVRMDGPSSLLALYRCPECGHRWRCWWHLAYLAGRTAA